MSRNPAYPTSRKIGEMWKASDGLWKVQLYAGRMSFKRKYDAQEVVDSLDAEYVRHQHRNRERERLNHDRRRGFSRDLLQNVGTAEGDDEFNENWARMKNEYGQLEREQEEQAFLSDPA
jgi:Spy/CpxP family protein refolding chaperone